MTNDIDTNVGDASSDAETFAAIFNNFLSGYNDGFNKAYDKAIAAGKSVFDARLDGFASGIRANQQYAQLNLDRALSTGSKAQAEVFEGLARHYESVERQIFDSAFAIKEAFFEFEDGLRSKAASELGNFGKTALGRGLAEGLGSAYDLYQMGDAFKNGDWNGLGNAGASSLAGTAASLLAIGLVGLLGVTSVPVLAVVGALGAVIGGLGGSLLWDKFHEDFESLASRILEAAFGINKDSSYRIVRYDPLALDLDGDGIISTNLEANLSGALFDNDGDGIRTATGWVGANDGLLVRDLNGNGIIDSGRELFGDQTRLADGSVSADGFQSLASLDENGDGKVDAQDAGFASLQVWRDANSNGITDAGELLSLADLGIVSFNVSPTERYDEPADGEPGGLLGSSDDGGSGSSGKVTKKSTGKDVEGGGLIASGTFTRIAADGTEITSVMQDFNFDNDSVHSKYVDTIEIPAELQDLANMQGLGKLRDLREASVLSPALAQAVRDFSAASTRADQRDLLEAVLFEWAKTNPTYHADKIHVHSGGEFEDEGSTNVIRLLPGEVLKATVNDLDGDTTRKVRVVEAILGAAPITDLWFGNTTVPQYLKVYDTFFEGAYRTLASQTRLKPYFDAISIQFIDDQIGFDFSQATVLMQDRFETDEISATADLVDLLRGESIFAENRADFLPMLSTWLGQIDAGGLGEAFGALFSGKVSLSDGVWTLGFESDADGGLWQVGSNLADVIAGNAADDYLYGGAGNDTLNGGSGNNRLEGGAGDDTLKVVNSNGSGTQNVFVGGTGNDTLMGGWASDRYEFKLGDGQDTIIETSYYTGAVDELAFGVGIEASDIHLVREGKDLIFQHSNGADAVRVKDQFSDASWNQSYQVEKVSFADGTSWSVAQIPQMDLVTRAADAGETLSGYTGRDVMYGGAGNDVLSSYEGNDALYGGAGNDTLNGGSGNNRLEGGAGDDTLKVVNSNGSGTQNVFVGGTGNDTLMGGWASDRYEFKLGDGQDTLIETSYYTGAVDELAFGAGIEASDIHLVREGKDLIFQHSNGADAVRVKDQFSGASWNQSYQVEKVSFADGTSWSIAQIPQMDLVTRAADAGETLSGYTGRDVMYGGAGNDVLSSYEGNDALYGGAGNDTLNGGSGNNRLERVRWRHRQRHVDGRLGQRSLRVQTGRWSHRNQLLHRCGG